jgi:hypothetical protein
MDSLMHSIHLACALHSQSFAVNGMTIKHLLDATAAVLASDVAKPRHKPKTKPLDNSTRLPD